MTEEAPARSNQRSEQKVPAPGAPLLVIVGPTAVGKTELSLHLAERFDGEIVSADSRLFYRGMDIGTAKPTREEREHIPHHLVDIAEPDQTVTLGAYQDMAYQAIEEILHHGRLPILVGGTGQYVMAIIEGWGIPRMAPRPALRRRLRSLPRHELHRWLSVLDPEAADHIHPHNVRRVIRALEVTLVSGQPISELQRKTPPPYDILIIGLWTGREALYERIDRRVERMMAGGLLEELEALKKAGYGPEVPAMSGLGYQQLWEYLRGESTLDEAVQRIKYETHRLVRHQNNWFKQDDPRINWFEVGDPDTFARIERFVAELLGEGDAPRSPVGETEPGKETEG